MAPCVAEWLERWICDQQVEGSNPSLPDIECNPGQVANTRASVTKQYKGVIHSVTSDLHIPSQPQGITAHWLVANYT